MSLDITQIPKGCAFFSTAQEPRAYALLLHDNNEQKNNILLLANLLNKAGVGVLCVSLKEIEQPVSKSIIQSIFDWLHTHYYKPQIAIGIGIGAYVQQLIEWKSAYAIVYIDAPKEDVIENITLKEQTDLFQSETKEILLDNPTAQQIKNSDINKSLPCMWLGSFNNLPSFEINSINAMVPLSGPFLSDSVNAINYSQLICSWITTKLPMINARSKEGDKFFVQSTGRDISQIHLGDSVLTYPLNRESSELVLLTAFAHASLLQIKNIALRNTWVVPRVKISIRAAESMHSSSVTKADNNICYMREITMLDDVDNVRKKAFHLALDDHVHLCDCVIKVINRVK